MSEESRALPNALELASDLEDDNFRGNTDQIVNIIRDLTEEYEDLKTLINESSKALGESPDIYSSHACDSLATRILTLRKDNEVSRRDYDVMHQLCTGAETDVRTDEHGDGL
jgi:hypothetical protein